MQLHALVALSTFAAAALAQTAIYPADYVAVPEGPLNSPNLPLALGTSRVMCLYETQQLTVPFGHTITQLGFRQDGGIAAIDTGRQLQLEVRIGYTTATTTTMVTGFDGNYAVAPTTVFGPALFTLPNLRDPGAPLPNGQLLLPLSTPFLFTPAPGQNLLVEYRVFGTSGGGGAFSYRLDRADYWSPVSYGPPGCAHATGGVPSLTVQPTRPGLGYSCSLSGAPVNSVGILMVDIGRSLVAPYALAPLLAGIQPSCTGQLQPTDLATLGGATGASGTDSWSFPIPNDNAFAKMPIASQALWLDFFSPGGMVVSRGAEVVTGLRPRSTILSAAGAPTVVTNGSLATHYCPVAFFVHQ
ncbi:MAG: hypothetical protein MUC36_08005 [Planctomycetes bacterium]|jgi:hypothetical protein|nr:hypothetical protein [Planctomycetota bacterium]